MTDFKLTENNLYLPEPKEARQKLIVETSRQNFLAKVNEVGKQGFEIVPTTLIVTSCSDASNYGRIHENWVVLMEKQTA